MTKVRARDIGAEANEKESNRLIIMYVTLIEFSNSVMKNNRQLEEELEKCMSKCTILEQQHVSMEFEISQLQEGHHQELQRLR